MMGRTIFRPVGPLAMAFIFVGVGNLAALWFNLYRLATLGFLIAIFVVQFSSSIRAVPGFGICSALVKSAPIYIYILLSTFWSPEPADAAVNALYMIAAVIPAIALGATLSRHYKGLDIAQGFGFLLVPFAIQAFISFTQGRNSMEVGDGTMRSLLGSIICLVSPIIAGAWAQTQKLRFVIYGLILAIFVVTMESRSTLLFAAPATLLSLYVHDRKMARRILLRSLIPLVLLMFLTGPSLISRFQSSSTSFNIGASVLDEFNLPIDERVDFDRRLTTFTAIQAFLDSPAFGKGYWSVYQMHRSDYGVELSAHGLIPGTLGELGIVGIVIFFMMVWRVMARAFTSVKMGSSVDSMTVHFLIGMLSLLMLGIFHQTIESPFFGLALALLMGLGCRRYKLSSGKQLARTVLLDAPTTLRRYQQNKI